MVRRRAWLAGVGAACAGWPLEALAEGAPVVLDRVVARWRTVDDDSRGSGHLIFARELAFQARIEAMALGDAPTDKLADRHIRAAVARHVTESLLEELPLDPVPRPQQVAERATKARKALEARVGGGGRLDAAREKERLLVDELEAMLRRTARASLYLDRMVAPLLDPSDIELRELHAAGKTPFTSERFVDAVDKLRRWVLSQRMAAAVDEFWQNARSRIVITWVKTKSGPSTG
ncbi:MAG: hypothetical protein IPM79_22460 [Polyangiaceae bacterium]|nr:hypothetical protein [Polyangiaceae bacterium]